jgi:hypothetical protein
MRTLIRRVVMTAVAMVPVAVLLLLNGVAEAGNCGTCL